MDVKKSRFYKYLLSDENIYLAIYSLESYIFEYDLLSKNDKIMFQRLKDKFCEKLICIEIIPKVREKIQHLILNKTAYISTKVYFNPKKCDGDCVEFRPLHTASLIEQMAIVAMLNLLIYEVPGTIEKDNLIHLSSLSRLIPSNFYGNRVSLKPKELFKPWKKQYQKYTGLTNECLKKYHATLEYKYEVTLDLEKFFPSVNPEFLKQYILERLPINLTSEDISLYSTLIGKLIYCKIENKLSTDLWMRYYFDGMDSIELDENRCEIFQNFTKGIPQGLPQSYFFGNIAMIPISEKFEEQFPGNSLFYVDDSVIFTNSVEEDRFKESLAGLNRKINDMVIELSNKNRNKLKEPFFELAKIYKLKVHEEIKSYYTKLDQADDGEIFLMFLSQESSHAATDIYRLNSDEEDNILKERMRILSDQVQNKISELSIKLEKLNENGSGIAFELLAGIKNISEIGKKEEINRITKFIDRLERYYKFFKNRYMILSLKESEDLMELENIIYQENNFNSENFLERFIYIYKKNVWGVAVSLYLKRMYEPNKIKKLKSYILRINKALFKFNNKESSYLLKIYIDLFYKDEMIEPTEVKPYDSLKNSLMIKMPDCYNKHSSVTENYVNKILYNMSRDEIMKQVLSEKLYKSMTIVGANTDELIRMVLNTIFSYLFTVEIDDSFVVRKKDYRPLRYGELRILLFVRNSVFNEEEFRSRKVSLKEYNNQLPIDSSLLEVTESFKKFVKSPIPIDNLVQTHQYICDIWKNGSKFLYFYTSHNQEHATKLIANVIKLILTFSYFQVSSLDFYIIFLACYLHDIAMVRIPALDSFLLNREDADDITLEFEQNFREKFNGDIYDVVGLKDLLIQVYKKMDTFYEKQVRDKHADNSAMEIRNVGELQYLDTCLREIVAEVSVAHVYETADIYFTKSEAANKQISMKFDKILLRLADALDISMFRISRPILSHNIDQMQDEHVFHWLSHLLIRDFELKMEYDTNKEKPLLNPGSIVEKVILKVFVEITQLSQCDIKEKCTFVGIDRKTLMSDSQFFDLECGKACSSEGSCNFLCKWFTEKNSSLLKELDALKHYLKRIPDNFYEPAIIVRIEMVDSTKLDAKQFEIMKRYLEKK